MYSAEISIVFDDLNEAKIVFNAVIPEINQEEFKRSKSLLYLKEKTLQLKVKAKDKNAFKASIYTYIKSIMLAKKILDICKEE